MGNCNTWLSECYELCGEDEQSDTKKLNPSAETKQNQTYDDKMKNRKAPLNGQVQNDNSSLPVTVEVPVEFTQFYDILELIGVGTTSQVYKVLTKHNKPLSRNKTHQEYLACKLIDKQQLTQGMMKADIEPFLNQLRREVYILRSVHHSNIVKCYDFMETHHKIFIITELLPGQELFDYIQHHGALQEDLAREILYQVFQAVAYLHDRGVMHRDIKPENIVFSLQHLPVTTTAAASSTTKTTPQVVAKLIDFGFSTIVKHTLTSSFLGTGGYLAPEMRQHRDYSTSVDDWALGILLYCTLSARLPFSVTIESLPRTNAQCRDTFALKFPKKHWSAVSSQAQDLIRALLAFDPMSRLTARSALQHPWFAPLRAAAAAAKEEAEEEEEVVVETVSVAEVVKVGTGKTKQGSDSSNNKSDHRQLHHMSQQSSTTSTSSTASTSSNSTNQSQSQMQLLSSPNITRKPSITTTTNSNNNNSNNHKTNPFIHMKHNYNNNNSSNSSNNNNINANQSHTAVSSSSSSSSNVSENNNNNNNGHHSNNHNNNPFKHMHLRETRLPQPTPVLTVPVDYAYYRDWIAQTAHLFRPLPHTATTTAGVTQPHPIATTTARRKKKKKKHEDQQDESEDDQQESVRWLYALPVLRPKLRRNHSTLALEMRRLQPSHQIESVPAVHTGVQWDERVDRLAGLLFFTTYMPHSSGAAFHTAFP